MKPKSYCGFAIVVLLVGMLLGQMLVKADSSEEQVKDNKLAVLWSSGDADVARNVCFMYTHTAKRKKWFDEVVLIIWGPSAKLLVTDKELQSEVKEMMADGVDVKACIVCAKRYGAVEDLQKLGIEVKGMGQPLTRILKSDWKILTF